MDHHAVHDSYIAEMGTTVHRSDAGVDTIVPELDYNRAGVTVMVFHRADAPVNDFAPESLDQTVVEEGSYALENTED